mmetsp:Transcript_8368/g.20676  ORF Transcript_8368/g.20676 Transcript_8368/m.20676 type:complete len:222 (-) Transcript_8368:490-1155(-)
MLSSLSTISFVNLSVAISSSKALVSNASISGSGTSSGKNGGKKTFDTWTFPSSPCRLFIAGSASGESFLFRCNSWLLHDKTATPNPASASDRAKGSENSGMMRRNPSLDAASTIFPPSVTLTFRGMLANKINGGADGGKLYHTCDATSDICRSLIRACCFVYAKKRAPMLGYAETELGLLSLGFEGNVPSLDDDSCLLFHRSLITFIGHGVGIVLSTFFTE